MAEWHVYLIRTRFDTLYTGIATDVARRFSEHTQSGSRGSKYLRSRGPLQLVYQAAVGARGLALRAEHRIRKLPRQHKEAIVRTAPGGRELVAMLGLEDQ